VILELSNDGSRIGATLIAASNSRYSKKSWCRYYRHLCSQSTLWKLFSTVAT
jgi:hypothetical protein